MALAIDGGGATTEVITIVACPPTIATAGCALAALYSPSAGGVIIGWLLPLLGEALGGEAGDAPPLRPLDHVAVAA